MSRRVLAAAAAALVALAAAEARGQESIRLSDVIASSGVGQVDLLRDLTPAQLEALRQDGAGVLLIGVDVNEASSGSEKASCQGLAVDWLALRVTVGGVTHERTAFRTATQALVARAGSSQRVLHYTLLGDSGSNRVTSNTAQAVFDDFIEVPCDLDLSAVTAATLEVHLLETNVALGDPEAFYDFSNGFEDLAVLNRADADFLAALAPGQDEAPAVILAATGGLAPASWSSYPSGAGYYTVGYEDQFPALGDYDFNDLLVSYRVEVGHDAAGDVVALRGAAFLVARGAGFTHDWRLRVPLAGASATGTLELTLTDPATLQTQSSATPVDGPVDLLGFADTRALFPPPPGFSYTNTERGAPEQVGPRLDFLLSLSAPLPAASVGAAPFDPYLVVHATGYEVHLPGQPPTAASRNVADGLTAFRDANGYPFAVLVPVNWPHPWEYTDLRRSYPDLNLYVSSNEQAGVDWYQRPAPAEVRAYLQADWEWGEE